MPPAAKKRKARQAAIARSESVVVRHALVRCRATRACVETGDAVTLALARRFNRKIGTAKWYILNKEELVARLVLHRLVRKIQRFVREKITLPADDGDSEGVKASVCPISLAPMSEISPGLRFTHTNVWYNREVLAQHMFKTSDFINPVTRVEFSEQDVVRIDPRLVPQFRNRRELRSSIAEDLAMVQSVENELEEVFQTMVEAAEEIPSRMEFRVVFDNLSQDFQECHGDLTDLDSDRSNLALKSLYDAIDGDPNNPVRMSKKRRSILRHFLDCQ